MPLRRHCDRGWVTGINPALWEKPVYEQMTVHPLIGFFEDIDLPSASFSAVVCSQVLEHIAQPDVFLAKVHRVLVPGVAWPLQCPTLGVCGCVLGRERAVVSGSRSI